MSNLLRLEDVLGETSGFAHAVFLAAAGLGNSSDTNAIQFLAEEISKRLEMARCIVDDLHGQPLANTETDLEALKNIAAAEIARRGESRENRDAA